VLLPDMMLQRLGPQQSNVDQVRRRTQLARCDSGALSSWSTDDSAGVVGALAAQALDVLRGQWGQRCIVLGVTGIVARSFMGAWGLVVDRLDATNLKQQLCIQRGDGQAGVWLQSACCGLTGACMHAYAIAHAMHPAAIAAPGLPHPTIPCT
jgi:hypothetical protein